jgi:hypothetical protein
MWLVMERWDVHGGWTLQRASAGSVMAVVAVVVAVAMFY